MCATIALNLVPGVLKRIFLSGIVKNDIYLGGESKRNALFFKKRAPRNAPIPPNSRKGPDNITDTANTIVTGRSSRSQNVSSRNFS